MTEKRTYVWKITPERKAELNKERTEHMRRGRDAAREARKVKQPTQSVNTASPTEEQPYVHQVTGR